MVSDFYTPNFFDGKAAPGVRYSFTGAITKPRQVLPGGYLSWHEPHSGHWWQQTWFSGSKPKFVDLGQLETQGRSIRTMVCAATPEHGRVGRNAAKGDIGRRTRAMDAIHARATESQAKTWRASIRALGGVDA
jgi:hypothetical protein